MFGKFNWPCHMPKLRAMQKHTIIFFPSIDPYIRRPDPLVFAPGPVKNSNWSGIPEINSSVLTELTEDDHFAIQCMATFRAIRYKRCSGCGRSLDKTLKVRNIWRKVYKGNRRGPLEFKKYKLPGCNACGLKKKFALGSKYAELESYVANEKNL